MNRRPTIVAAATAIVLCLAAGSLWAEAGGAARAAAAPPRKEAGAGTGASPYSVSSSVDWKARVLSVRVTLDLGAAGLRLPSGRLEAERMTASDLPALAKGSVLALRYDSSRDVEDTMTDGDLAPELFLSLQAASRLASASLSKDLGSYVADYELPLDSVAALYLDGSSPAPARAPIDAVPTRDYTGIVVYAKGELPVHGEARRARAAPCLFPRIYDEGMSLVLDRSRVAPEALSSGGVLGYAEELDLESSARVGAAPLRVMARELYGEGRTDYVISREDALRILSSPANRDLLRLGKVVVILDL